MHLSKLIAWSIDNIHVLGLISSDSNFFDNSIMSKSRLSLIILVNAVTTLMLTTQF